MNEISLIDSTLKMFGFLCLQALDTIGYLMLYMLFLSFIFADNL